MNAGTRQLTRQIMYDRRGRHRWVLNLRSALTRFAATRGWVIPFLTVRDGVAEKWRKAPRDGNLGYAHYLELRENSRVILKEIQARTTPSDRILDLGCNVGRELNQLWQAGYRNLTGVEIGEEPVRAMREVFAEMAGGSRIINNSMTAAIQDFNDGEFDLVYAHGSLISLNAREQFVFDEMCRITRRWIITMENERSKLLFPRDFGKVFAWRGMRQVAERTMEMEAPKGGIKCSTLRVFEKRQG